MKKIYLKSSAVLGIISYSSARPLDYPDLVRTGSLTPYESKDGRKAAFGFMISFRKGKHLRKLLEERKKLIVEAKVKAELHSSQYENVTTLPSSFYK